MLEARTLSEGNIEEIATWCGGRVVTQYNALEHSTTVPGLNVPTPDGVMRAQLGDTIVQDNDGTFMLWKFE